MQGITHKILKQFLYFKIYNLTSSRICAPGVGPIAETWRETVSVCNVVSGKLVSYIQIKTTMDFAINNETEPKCQCAFFFFFSCTTAWCRSCLTPPAPVSFFHGANRHETFSIRFSSKPLCGWDDQCHTPTDKGTFLWHLTQIPFSMDSHTTSSPTHTSFLTWQIIPSAKWNTNLMQHCAGFISAESLYLFRALVPETCRVTLQK